MHPYSKEKPNFNSLSIIHDDILELTTDHSNYSGAEYTAAVITQEDFFIHRTYRKNKIFWSVSVKLKHAIWKHRKFSVK